MDGENNKITEETDNFYPLFSDKEYYNNPIVNRTVYYKRLVDKTLTIILVEKTQPIAKEREKLIKLISSLIPLERLCIIEYGSSVTKSGVFDSSTFNTTDFLHNVNEEENKVCLFDALVELKKLVSEQYMHVEENEKERIKISDIYVIGIGTCKDNGSAVSKEEAINCFYNVVNRFKVTTKYFCLTEDSFMNAAELGFHSIGAIIRNY